MASLRAAGVTASAIASASRLVVLLRLQPGPDIQVERVSLCDKELSRMVGAQRDCDQFASGVSAIL